MFADNSTLTSKQKDLGALLLGCCLCRSKFLSYGLQKSWWRGTLETDPQTSFSLLPFWRRTCVHRRPGRPSKACQSTRSHGSETRAPSIGGGAGRMGAGIGAGDHRNDGARRLTAASHYKEVGGEEEGPFRPRTHPGAYGRVGEGAGCRTAAT